MTNLDAIVGRLPINTITFDMDDTLWDFQAAMENALHITLARLRLLAPGERTDNLTVPKMMDIRDAVALELGEGATRQEEIRHAAMVRTVEYVDPPDRAIADNLFRTYMEARLAGAKPYREVRTVLETLKQRYRIGVISNGNNEPESVGLPGLFDFVVFAHDCGYPKPDPRIFEFALAQSGDDPGNVVHVGDSLESDVQGANNYGILSVWLNRRGVANATPISPRWEVRDLEELTVIL